MAKILLSFLLIVCGVFMFAYFIGIDKSQNKMGAARNYQVKPLNKKPAIQRDFIPNYSSNAKPDLPKPKSQLELEKESLEISLEERIIRNRAIKSPKWASKYHNEPVSDLRKMYDSDENTPLSSLPSLVVYTKKEIAVAKAQYPISFNIKKTPSILKSLDLAINVKETDLNKISLRNITDEDDIQIALLGLNCPNIDAFGGRNAADEVQRFFELYSNPPKLKSTTDGSDIIPVETNIIANYKSINSDKLPLALIFLKIDDVYFSLNRSLVYSGVCIVDRRFNEDPFLLAIESDAKRRHVGLWSFQEPI